MIITRDQHNWLISELKSKGFSVFQRAGNSYIRMSNSKFPPMTIWSERESRPWGNEIGDNYHCNCDSISYIESSNENILNVFLVKAKEHDDHYEKRQEKINAKNLVRFYISSEKKELAQSFFKAKNKKAIVDFLGSDIRLNNKKLQSSIRGLANELVDLALGGETK